MKVKHLLLAAAALSAAAPVSAATVVTAARMLDVTTGRYVESPAIFIDDSGHITSIADARTVEWDANVKQINRGAGGYVGDALYAHPIILEYADEHPGAVIGGVDVFANDGTFRPMPEDIAGKGHYYSEVTQYARFHMPVTGLALGVLSARPITELY